MMHNQLLALISTVSQDMSSDGSSSVSPVFTIARASNYWPVQVHPWSDSSRNSSNSFSMLPAEPKIFHGRESELGQVVQILQRESPRIAILGPGGIGKTSLAKAALHHLETANKYQHRFFVATDSATTSIELAALIGSHLGVKPGKNLTKPIVAHFSNSGPCLLVLDNLEPSWEPMNSRNAVEELLSTLTSIPHLALMITMRGAERPAKVRWTHPFLAPLNPISNDAARQTFIDIAEDFHSDHDMNQLLALTDNMPLAVNLMAHLVDYEGCHNVLTRWETEKTSVLSGGYDKRSSLDTSITMSLASPRMSLGAKDLLSLLSILPDGLSDVELLQSELPIKDILGCKSILLRTSLASNDSQGRLKSLVPIREYMKHVYPASYPVIRPLRKYFHLLLDLYLKFSGTERVAGRVHRITLNLGNLHQVLLHGLHSDNPDLRDTIKCIMALNNFNRHTGHSGHALMDNIPAILPSAYDSNLEASFIMELFGSQMYHSAGNPEQLIARATVLFSQISDPSLQSRFHGSLGHYYLYHQKNVPEAIKALDKAVLLADPFEDTLLHLSALNTIAGIRCTLGEYSAAQVHAVEAQRLAQLSGSLYMEAQALWTEAICCRDLGNYKASIPLCHRARKLLELCGMGGGYLDQSIITSEAELHLLKSEYAQARHIHADVVQQTRNEDAFKYALSLLNLAEIDVMIGTTENVRESLDNAKEILNARGNVTVMNFCEMLEGDLHFRQRDIWTAKTVFEKCLHLAWKTDNQTTLYGLERLADVTRWTVDGSNAVIWPVIYLVYTHKVRNKRGLYKALQFLGDSFLVQKDKHTAQSLLLVALEGLTQMDIHHSRGQCMLHLGDIAQGEGNLAKAIKLWKAARPLFELSLQAKEISQIDTRLAAVNQSC
ncbi:hypothetical protein DFH09DRAFT_1124279 [Mycena vulgaris]|nr:hypothetical protein DFH09DRAFT_1124279 [Mycena vulgaris]